MKRMFRKIYVWLNRKPWISGLAIGFIVGVVVAGTTLGIVAGNLGRQVNSLKTQVGDAGDAATVDSSTSTPASPSFKLDGLSEFQNIEDLRRAYAALASRCPSLKLDDQDTRQEAHNEYQGGTCTDDSNTEMGIWNDPTQMKDELSFAKGGSEALYGSNWILWAPNSAALAARMNAKPLPGPKITPSPARSESSSTAPSVEAQASQSAAAAAAAAAEAAKRGTITGGVVVVGTDIDPGVYKTDGPYRAGGEDMCYYAFKTGTDANAQIIDNNIVQGPATVTLKQGNVFETSSCDDWHKQ
jgi:hypothetical protein